jgi:hypothetical protein
MAFCAGGAPELRTNVLADVMTVVRLEIARNPVWSVASRLEKLLLIDTPHVAEAAPTVGSVQPKLGVVESGISSTPHPR